MKRLFVVALLSLSCVKPPTVTASDAGVTVAPKAGATKYALDADKLKRFMAYRTKLRAAYASAPSQLSPDAGGADAVAFALEAANRRAQARATCAAEAGLAPADALIIEAMVFNVMAQRAVAKNGEYARLLEQVKASLDNMHPDQKVDAIKDMEELEGMLKKMATADALRETLGGANVDLILAHGDDLMPIYEHALRDERAQ